MTTSGYVGPADQEKQPENDPEPRSLKDGGRHKRLLRELLVERFGPIRTAWRERA